MVCTTAASTVLVTVYACKNVVPRGAKPQEAVINPIVYWCSEDYTVLSRGEKNLRGLEESWKP